MDKSRIGRWVVALGVFLALASLAATHAQQVEPTQPAEEPKAAPPERLTRLQGAAYFSRNEDVVGATVVVHSMTDPNLLYLTSTDGKGKFRIEGLQDGDYRVSVERHGVERVVKENVSVKFPFRAVVELPMSEVARGRLLPTVLEEKAGPAAGSLGIRGTVRDQETKPVGEVHVRLTRTDGEADPVMATTRPDGTFELSDFPSGAWLLTVVGVGKLPIRTMLYMRENGELHVTLVRQPASYEPSPLELMPPEHPIPPEAMSSAAPDGRG